MLNVEFRQDPSPDRIDRQFFQSQAENGNDKPSKEVTLELHRPFGPNVPFNCAMICDPSLDLSSCHH
jgi:hypothetical protein